MHCDLRCKPASNNPPRKATSEHLHRAGSAGGDCQHVRGVSRTAGLKRIAQQNQSVDGDFAGGLKKLGFACPLPFYFDTIAIKTMNKLPASSECGVKLRRKFPQVRLKCCAFLSMKPPRAKMSNASGMCSTMLMLHLRWQTWTQVRYPIRSSQSETHQCLPDHPVFNTHHSETEMLRYIRALSDKDLALDRAMIPLGSCTMKLNATSEMIR